jgi:RNA polymerase sigma-70 factor (ECF subfamily)
MIGYARTAGLGRDEAEDVAQFGLQKVTEHIERFEYDPKRGGFKKWLRTIINNRVRQKLRRKPVYQASTDCLIRQVGEQTPDEIWDQMWLEQHLRYCLEIVQEQVELRTYKAFCAVALEERDPKEVSEEVGLSVNQIYVARSRVTKKLRTIMSELFPDEFE